MVTSDETKKTKKLKKPIQILHLEDDPADQELVQATLKKSGILCQITWVKTSAEFEGALQSERYDLILADYQLSGYDGLLALRHVKEHYADIPFIFVSGTIGEDAAIQAFTEGGTDYVPKGKLLRLAPSIERELERVKLRQENKQAQEALETERKRMEVILSALNTGLSLINPDMTIAWVNPKIREMFPDREPVGQVCHVFYESRATVCDGCGTIQAFVNGKIYESEQFVPSTGKWYYIISQPIKDITGRVVNVLEGITDITERKHAEERQRLQSTALQAAANGIVITDLAGNVQWVNSAFTKLTGYTSGEILGKNPRLLKSGKQDLMFYQNLWDTILAGEIWHGEIVNKRKDGSQYIEEMTIAPVRQPSGEISHFIAIKQDISARKQAEKVQTSVYRISEAAQSIDNLNDLYKQIHSIISELMPARNFVIASYDPASDLLHFPYFADESDTDWSPIKPGRSLCAYVLRTGNPLLATPEVFKQLMSSGEVELVGKLSVDWLGVPLKTQQGQSIGVMVVQTYTEDVRLNSTDMEILEFVSTQVAMAIERKRAEIEIHQHNEDLALINSINAAFNRGDSLATITSLISEEASHIFNSLGVTFNLVNTSRDRLEMQNVALPTRMITQIEKVIGMTIPPIVHDLHKANPFRRVIENKQAVLVTDPSQIQEYIYAYTESLAIPAKTRPILRKLGPLLVKLVNIRSQLIVPLVVKNEVIGTLDIGSCEILTEVDLRRAVTLASQFTLVIEHKRGEEALQESQRQLATLMGNLPGIAYRCANDPNWTMEFISDGCYPLTGYQPEELIGNTRIPYAQIIHPEDRQMVWNVIQAQLEKKLPYQLNYRIVTASGEEKWVWEQGQGVSDSSGRLIALEGFITNITERKRAEEALSESNTFNTMLLQTIPLGMDIVDENGQILFMSPALEKVIGQNALGAHCWDVYKDDKQQCAGCPLMKNIELGVTKTLESSSILGGNVFEISHTGIIFRGKKAILEVFYNITERKGAEEALRGKTEELDRYFTSALDLLCIADSDGYFRRLNREWESALGYTLAELEGHRFLDFVHPDDMQATLEAISQLNKQETILNFINRYRHRDGSYRWIEWRSIPAGNLIYAAARDITARIQTEENLRQRLVELEALHHISTALRTAQTRAKALPILLDETLTALDTDSGIIWLYHPVSGELRTEVTRGWLHDLEQLTLKPGEGISGSVFVSGQTYLCAEIAADPLFCSPSHNIPAGWGGIGVPIRTAQETIGVIFIAISSPHQITAEQTKLLTSLAELAGATLHRMSLHEEAILHLAHLQALHSIDRAIATSTDLRMTLDILLEQVTTQLNVDAASILLLNPHLHTLEYAAGRGFRTRAIQTAHIRLGESLAGRAALERRIVQLTDPAMIKENPQFAALWAAEGFAAYYGIPLNAKGQIKGVLEVFNRTPLAPGQEWESFFETLAGQAAIAVDTMQLFDGLQRSNIELALAYDTTLEGWAKALELRDQDTEGHTRRVTEMTEQLARAMNFSEHEISHIRRGALLHDMGKMGVPDNILLKPGKLTDEEWVVMRRHPLLAFNMLSSIEYLRPALDIPYCHHEKWDGTGYPRGLKGNEIPLSARIFAVVDVYDALNSDRPYRNAWPKGKVLEHIKAGSGSHFDPKVVETFLELVKKEM